MSTDGRECDELARCRLQHHCRLTAETEKMGLAHLDISLGYGDFRIFTGFLPREEVTPDRPYSKSSKSCADTAEYDEKEFTPLWW
jgi:hypothetical protein